MLGVIGLSHALRPTLRALRSLRLGERRHVVAFRSVHSVWMRLLSSDRASDITASTILDIPRMAADASIRKGPTFNVRTLRPKKLTQDDYISLNAAQSGINVRFCNLADSGSTSSYAHSLLFPTPADMKFRLPATARETFPAGLQGFVYYWSPSNITPLAGEVRFRQTASSDPSSFARGEDYHSRMGLPWRIPLFNISSVMTYRSLREVLLCHNLASVQTMDWAQELYKKRKLMRNWIKRGISECTIKNLCHVKGYGLWHRKQPFKGKILCHFEPSEHPLHAGTRTVVIRVLRILSPIEYASRSGRSHNIPLPAEGELLLTFLSFFNPGDTTQGGTDTTKTGWKWGIWAVDVDSYSSYRELRVLFENQDVSR